jgi:hypothetical protein
MNYLELRISFWRAVASIFRRVNFRTGASTFAVRPLSNEPNCDDIEKIIVPKQRPTNTNSARVVESMESRRSSMDAIGLGQYKDAIDECKQPLVQNRQVLSNPEKAPMIEEIYKLHHLFIASIEDFDSETWTPRIFVWLPVEFFTQIKIKKSFPSQAEAVDSALKAARQWIDLGKPELFPEKCEGDTILQ